MTFPDSGPRRRSKGWRTLAPLLAFAAIVLPALDAAAQGRGGGRAAAVAVDAVRTEPLMQTLPVLGRIVARESGAVAARERGAVEAVRVDVGDRVKGGAVIAILVTDSLRADLELRQSEVLTKSANVAMRRAERDQKKQEFDRIKQLQGSGAFPKARFDDVEQEVKRAEAMLASADAELGQARAMRRQAEIALDYGTIRAPYPGVVTERHVSRGEFVDPGDPVVTLVNDEDLEIEADVPFERIRVLEPGAVVRAGFNGTVDNNAVVRAIVPNENPLTRTRLVRFTPDFDGPGLGLAINQSIDVLIPIGEGRRVLTMAKDALLKDTTGTYVFIVEDGKAVRRNVRIGEGVGNRFEVLSGVEEGQEVVVRGNERLRPGQAVTVGGADRATRGSRPEQPS